MSTLEKARAAFYALIAFMALVANLFGWVIPGDMEIWVAVYDAAALVVVSFLALFNVNGLRSDNGNI